MRKPERNFKRRNLYTGILLAVLLFRAYVPVGFMPASGTPFLLELCPEAAPMQMPAHHHHHSDAHTHFDHCPFGSAPAAGPVSQLIVFEPPGQIASATAIAFDPLRRGVRPERAHLPRGPPALS
jgi:hypothetical protein